MDEARLKEIEGLYWPSGEHEVVGAIVRELITALREARRERDVWKNEGRSEWYDRRT